ncbi:hypothetical protein LTR84_004794 [Exophiala bonariae]|uniref:Xylanolytic transcriptional activator regulatory domain-containing protein n=1 Tax=Exophiala bonariae TaxID=1690606 RepID=A0AAV9NRM8_9EURO|nr:hypothetical protein LTR84_004794 [Exophiala bonariae]
MLRVARGPCMLNKPVQPAKLARRGVMEVILVNLVNVDPWNADTHEIRLIALSKQMTLQAVLPPAPQSQDLTVLNKLVYALQSKVAILEQQQVQGTGTRSPHGTISNKLRKIGEGMDRELPSQPNFSTFAGPTSANFSFGLAKLMLDQENASEAGISDLEQEVELAGSVSLGRETDEDDVPGAVDFQELQRNPMNSKLLYGMEKSHALNLLQIYHECVGVLHPIADISSLQTQVDLLWPSSKTSLQDKSIPPTQGGNFAHLKMVLAIGLLAEGGGASALSERIFHELQPVATSVVFAKNFNLHGQILLLLMAFFHMFKDDCRLASRYVAIACRLMIEAGLHQKHILMRRFIQSEARTEVINVLVACVILDRQLNFNAGLPFTLKDTDIDITETGTLNPYAKAMTSYIRIGPPAWAAVTDERGRAKQRIKDEDFDYVDYQVQRWQESLPAYLRLQRGANAIKTTSDGHIYVDQGTQFLRFILYLRANQFRIVVMRPLLFSSQTYMANIKRIRIVAQIAQDTVETIEEMNEKYDLYKKQQPVLNLFLSSALSTLFLVYIHSLREQRTGASDDTLELATWNQGVRDGLNKGLALIQAYSTYRSSQRLWQKFAGPHGLLSRLSLADHAQTVEGATSTVSGSRGVSLQSGTSYEPPKDSDIHGQTQPPTVGSAIEPPAYPDPAAADFRLIQTANPFQPYEFTDYSPLPFLNMNPLLVSNDIDVFYDNMWDDNMF